MNKSSLHKKEAEQEITKPHHGLPEDILVELSALQEKVEKMEGRAENFIAVKHRKLNSPK